MSVGNDALSGIRILDLSRLLPGPACTWYLQGMGALVDRIEPLTGDLTRVIPPFVKGVGAYFRCFSRGKRSLALDTRNPLAAEIILALLPSYDVLVEGFKPGVLEKMGLVPADLIKKHPTLIIARLSGYGQTGPLSLRPGHDINYLSLTGILSAQHVTSDEITIPAVQIADMCGAVTAAMAISAALVKRYRKGTGQVLDVSLSDAALALASPILAGAHGEHRELRPGKEALSGGLPTYRCYRCSDDRWVAVGAIEPKFQKILREAFGSLDPEALVQGFRTETSRHWEELLKHACVTRIRLASEVFVEPQYLDRARISGIDIQPPIGQINGEHPSLGADGHAILTEAQICPELVLNAIKVGALKLQEPDESGAQADNAAPTT